MTYTVRCAALWRTLERFGVEVSVVGNQPTLRGNVGAVDTGLLADLSARRAELLADAAERDSLHQQMAAYIDLARSWEELETTLVVAEDAWRQQAISGTHVRSLIAAAARLSKSLPERLSSYDPDAPKVFIGSISAEVPERHARLCPGTGARDAGQARGAGRARSAA